MSTPDAYRAMAEECFRWARRAQTEDKRQAYLDVARTWLEAASWKWPFATSGGAADHNYERQKSLKRVGAEEPGTASIRSSSG